MVLAVPITAVLRIHLAHVQHPLPRYIAQLIGGGPARSNSVTSNGGQPDTATAFRKLPPAGAAARPVALAAAPDVEASAGLLSAPLSEDSTPPEPDTPP